MVTGLLTVPSAKAEITFPRADKDLLIFLASSRTAPSAPVLLTYQGTEKAVMTVRAQNRKSERTEGQQAGPAGKQAMKVGKNHPYAAVPGVGS